MSKPKNCIISVEVFKYPYCGKSIESIESEEFLSEKIYFYTIKIREKVVRKTKQVFVYGQLIFFLSNRLAPIQAIGLPILPTIPSIMRSIDSNAGLPKKAIIAQLIQDIPLTKRKWINCMTFLLSAQITDNSISQDELMTTLTNLRGGSLVDVAVGLAIIAAIIILVNNANGFQPNPHLIVPPYLQWLYGNNYKPGQFGYEKVAGPRSIPLTRLQEWHKTLVQIKNNHHLVHGTIKTLELNLYLKKISANSEIRPTELKIFKAK